MHIRELRVTMILLLVGLLAVLVPRGGVQDAACAACAKVLPTCGPTDNTLTSALTVGHYEERTTAPVEPDTGETWEVKAVYATALGAQPAPCACQEVNAAVAVDVDWNGTSWSATCTGCNPTTGPIFAVNVCVDDDTAVCSDGEENHSWGYKLVANVARINTYNCIPFGGVIANLDRVEYRPTSIDDGNVIDAETCAEGDAVTPVGSSYTSVIDSAPGSVTSTAMPPELPRRCCTNPSDGVAFPLRVQSARLSA